MKSEIQNIRATKVILSFAAAFLCTAALFLSCQKELSCEGCLEDNKPPIANAGADQTIALPKDSVFLDGSASSDPDGTITSYKWAKITGPASANIAKPDSSKTMVKSLEAGIYQFELTVTDNGGLSAKDTVQIMVDDPRVNQAPVAVAGVDANITLPTDSVLLDGSQSFDIDGIIISYKWLKIAGPSSANILKPDSAKTIAKALVAGVYQFELTVKDNGGLSAKDTVVITVDAVPANHPPIACAGANQTITLPTNATDLDGSCSTDSDNNITGYQWSKIAGPASFTIGNASAVQTPVSNLVEGVYQFELKVTDAGGLVSNDTMQVTVISCDPFTGCNGGGMWNLPTKIQGTVTQIGTLSVPRMPTAGAAGNKVVFAGGFINFHCGSSGWWPTAATSKVDIYDILNRSWSTANLSIPRGGIRSVSCGNKIFFAGGENGISATYDNVDIYDVSTNTWAVAHLSKPRAYITTATVGNKVFFAGGYYDVAGSSAGSVWGISNIVDVYDISTNQWSATTLSGVATGLGTATTLLDKVYFAGGKQNPRIIDIYDNATNTWSTSNLQVGWQNITALGNPVVSFAAQGAVHWLGWVDEGVFYVPFDGECSNVYTGREEIRNFANGTTTINCAPLVYPSHVVYRNDEIAFFTKYFNPPGSRNYSGWAVHHTFSVYNTTTKSWSDVDINFSINPGFDAGVASINNTVYIGGGSDFGTCVKLLDKVYTINW